MPCLLLCHSSHHAPRLPVAPQPILEHAALLSSYECAPPCVHVAPGALLAPIQPPAPEPQTQPQAYKGVDGRAADLETGSDG